MGKPDDIPQDVWDAANAINGILTPTGVAKIARLLLAERERCAKVADRYTGARFVRQSRELTTHEVYEVKIFARLIAAAIRKGAAGQ